MSDAHIAGTRPIILELEPGTYWWCSCGRSAGQPFCDGSHKGTDFAPLKYEVTEARKVALCACKHTQGAPLCDGSHRAL